MNSYKDLQVETRRRNERRDHRKAFFAARERVNGARALSGPAHLEPNQREGHGGSKQRGPKPLAYPRNAFQIDLHETAWAREASRYLEETGSIVRGQS